MTDFTIDRPVAGDIRQTDQNTTPQIDSAAFLELLDNVLNIEGVWGVRWAQYTPYFNDGDACVFSINDPRVLFSDPEDSDGEEQEPLFEGGYTEYDSGYSPSDLYTGKDGTPYGSWIGSYPNRHLDPNSISFITKDGRDLEPIYTALRALAHTDQWEQVALKNFGDHAEVTATKAGFSVESYDHD